uniref:Putative kinase-like protein TMKL1 n=1 Tax=Anthurium amnicola TaxID=1678845 RepID=A0A1D1YY35_9ARAE
MGVSHGVRVLLGVVSPFVAVLLLFFAMHRCRHRSVSGDHEEGGTARRRRWRRKGLSSGGNRGGDGEEEEGEEEEAEAEELISFPGGEDLTAHAILDAPGEVVGKSSYGTLYRACVGGGRGSPMLLRFVRPACIGRTGEILPAVQLLGLVRHPNLVPLRALYVGPRGEKLFVHPFFPAGNLSHFLLDGNVESHKWEVIHKIALGIAEGLDHLHNGLLRPVIHGNLKSKNVLFEAGYQSRLSDFGLHLLLHPSSGQEMLDASSAEGYKAPELIKMRDASKESDIYSLGVIMLELVTLGKQPDSGDLVSNRDLRLSNSITNPAFHKKVLEALSPELLRQSREQNCITEEGLLTFYRLALSCCSPSPLLRPDVKHVMRKLEELGRQFGSAAKLCRTEN